MNHLLSTTTLSIGEIMDLLKDAPFMVITSVIMGIKFGLEA